MRDPGRTRDRARKQRQSGRTVKRFGSVVLVHALRRDWILDD